MGKIFECFIFSVIAGKKKTKTNRIYMKYDGTIDDATKNIIDNEKQ